MDSIGQERGWKHARCGAEWQNNYLTIIEIVKDLRIVPCLTAVSAEKDKPPILSPGRKISWDIKEKRVVTYLILNKGEHLFKKRKTHHKNI